MVFGLAAAVGVGGAGPGFEDGGGEGVFEAEGDGLDEAGVVEVGEIAARVPTGVGLFLERGRPARILGLFGIGIMRAGRPRSRGGAIGRIIGIGDIGMMRAGRPRSSRVVIGVDRGLAGELRGDFDEGLRDQDGDGVEVAGVGAEAEALGLQGDRAASAEGVIDRRGVLGEESVDRLGRGLAAEDLADGGAGRQRGLGGPVARFDLRGGDAAGDLGAGAVEDDGVVGVLPADEFLDEGVEP